MNLNLQKYYKMKIYKLKEAIEWKYGKGIRSSLDITTPLVMSWSLEIDPLTTQECIDLCEEYEFEEGYKQKRENEYPTIVNQMDLLYHHGYDGWRLEIEKIKLKHPKPVK